MKQFQRISAVLGPTNTGKTHYAIERMLSYKSGIIGLPLRLLAREVYDKIVRLRGFSSVALLTGEERIVPSKAQYWVCTVEAMPEGMSSEFLAVDEIQLANDPERGHVFTARLLESRGSLETLFLGSETMRHPIKNLVPDANFISRERLSELVYTGSKKISRIPTRSAIVGFSVDNVYSIAEILRRLKGGAAVVMGALSPRTRNAQVELYQNGDVDYLVATDAIGMGLNLDVNHVAFSSLTKFDGRRSRDLAPNELAQIAGRAGRGMNNGTFGVTGEAKPLDPKVATSIMEHRFTPQTTLQWRNTNLEFGTIDRLITSLEVLPDNPSLIKARDSDDLLVLKTLNQSESIVERVKEPAAVKLLWKVCSIPDFRSIGHGEHASLLETIFTNLFDFGRIPDDWLQETNVPIAQDNTYYYNVTYSKQNKENVFSHLPPDWKDDLCYTVFPFRAIYSDAAITTADSRVNNWLVYRALSFHDFPQNYGNLTSLDGIQNKAILARFENKSLLYNNLLTIDTSNPQAAYIGNPRLFDSSPPIDFAETDLGYVGSQNKFLLKIPQGQITVDAKRGQVFLVSGTKVQDLTAFGSGVNRFMADHLPFEILEHFPNVPTDNHFNSIGLHGVYGCLLRNIHGSHFFEYLILFFHNQLFFDSAHFLKLEQGIFLPHQISQITLFRHLFV